MLRIAAAELTTVGSVLQRLLISNASTSHAALQQRSAATQHRTQDRVQRKKRGKMAETAADPAEKTQTDEFQELLARKPNIAEHVAEPYNPFETFYDDSRRNNNFGIVRGFTGAYVKMLTPTAKMEIGAKVKPVDFSKISMPPVEKDLYEEHPEAAARSQEEVDSWLDEHQVTLTGDHRPRPVLQFSELNVDESLRKLLSTSYEAPTFIQSISWPVALSGHDMVSVARTGSGKTLAFIIPGIVHTQRQETAQRREKRSPYAASDGPVVLVLSPTRELSQQVVGVSTDYCRAMGLEIGCLYGGSGRSPQAATMRRGVDVCVATPGRMLDFIEDNITTLMRCSYLVLDEADRMLNMGFEPQIRKILSQIRPDRQTLMFTATWPQEVRQLASEFLTDPVVVNVGSSELAANPNIDQRVKVLDPSAKESELCELMKDIAKDPDYKVLIFVDTKKKADYLALMMKRARYPVRAIHADKSQTERNWVLDAFRSGKARILVATDVAARGIDITDIKTVINFDYPQSTEDYVHRIGRTARVDRKGTSYTFFTYDETYKAEGLIRVLEQAKQEVPAELKQILRLQSSFVRSNRR